MALEEMCKKYGSIQRRSGREAKMGSWDPRTAVAQYRWASALEL